MDCLLLDQLLYLKIDLQENITIEKQISKKMSLQSPYKILFDSLNQITENKLEPSKIALGIRYKEEKKNKDEKGILELFIFYYNKKIFDLIINESEKRMQIKEKELIHVILQPEGLIRNTWLPFEPKKDTLDNGKIDNLLDYNKNRRISENNIQETIKPFIKISSNLKLVQVENLYQPEDIINLREKNIIFEEFEVIYLQNWSG